LLIAVKILSKICKNHCVLTLTTMGTSSKNAASLPCPLCCQTNFPNIDALRIGLIKVTSRPLKCPICDEILLGLDKLTIHLFGHTLLVDQDNPKPAKKPAKEKREMVPKAVKFKERIEPSVSSVCRCEFCGFTFQDSEILTMHMKLVHKYCDRPSDEPENPSDRKFQCHLCSKYFKLKGALRIHLKVAHVGFYSPRRQNRKNLCEALRQQHQQQPPVATITQPPLVSAFPIQPLDVPFQGHAQQLQLTYSHDGIQLVHSRSLDQIALPSYQLATAHSPKGLDVPEHQFASPLSSPTAVISETGVKTWECDICAKSFTTKYFLKKHKRLHTGKRRIALIYEILK
jgi:KRAB domain-containing zinc finger protein